MRKIAILTTLLVCLSTFILEKAFSEIVPENFDKKYKTPLVLTVDGMSPSATFSPTEKLREPYLSKTLQNTESFKVINPGNQEMPSFSWSGDITQSSSEIENLKVSILALVNKAKKEDCSFTIVSHSWGTVLTYCALKELEKEGKLKDGDIDRLITLGSPMGGEQLNPSEILLKSHSLAKDYISTELKEEPGKLSKPAGVTEWVNYWSSNDSLSGDISAADYNSKVSGGHDAYYTDSNITWKIAGEIAMGAKDNVIGNSANSSQQAVISTSTQEAIKYADLTYKIPFAKISPPELANKINDSSQYSERNPQQQLTSVSTSFTQTFDGLFTQSADSLGSLGGNHSGTLTDGTRIGTGSRPGDFTSGSFSGRTIAETGYTPATHNNAAFSGSSVGTATAKGFQEGDLKGSMTVTVPAGTQTATVSGSITISTDGSLSMPSYSGPVTDNGTSTKVGTMSGSWSQGPTQ